MKILYYGSGNLPDGVAIGLLTRWPDHQLEQASVAGAQDFEGVDALVVDLGEPGALAAIKAARADSDTLPIVGLLPEGADDMTELRAMRDGADGVKPKDAPPLVLAFSLAAILRRRGQADDGESWQLGPLAYDPRMLAWSLRGVPLRLTPTESRLLLAVAQRRGGVADYDRLLRQVWGDAAEEATIRKYAQRLRQKGIPLLTVPGVGYRILADVARAA